MHSTKFVQKLAFAYRTCPLSLETTKHFQAYINSVLWSGIYANSNNVATLKRQPTKVADKNGWRGLCRNCSDSTLKWTSGSGRQQEISAGWLSGLLAYVACDLANRGCRLNRLNTQVIISTQVVAEVVRRVTSFVYTRWQASYSFVAEDCAVYVPRISTSRKVR